MPTYEYRCKACDHRFIEIMTIREHDAFKPKCPKCTSRKVEQMYSAFFAKTSRKS